MERHWQTLSAGGKDGAEKRTGNSAGIGTALCTRGSGVAAADNEQRENKGACDPIRDQPGHSKPAG